MDKDAMKAVIEGIQMVVRLAVISVIPVMISQLQGNGIDWNVIWVTFAIAVLTGIERAFYIYGKETDEMNPISQFLKFQLPTIK